MTTSLPTRALPGTERVITRLGLGAMHLSLARRPPRDEAKAVVRRAVEAGIRLIDTADAYALDDADMGHNERLVAEVLREMGVDLAARDAPVVATKGGRTRPGGSWAIDGRPEHLRAACHASLERMGLERISLYQLHTPDPDVPFTESVGALARLREEGKVEAVGLSNVSVAQIDEARALVPVATVQNSLSPWDVGIRKSPVLACCERHGIVFMAYSPLGGRERAAMLGGAEALQAVAREVGASPQEVVLAWLVARSDMLVPIPGASRTESVDSTVRAAGLALAPEVQASVLRALRALPGRAGLGARVVGKLRRILGR